MEFENAEVEEGFWWNFDAWSSNIISRNKRGESTVESCP